MCSVLKAFAYAILLVTVSMRAADTAYPAEVNRFEDQANLIPKDGQQVWRDRVVERLAAFEKQTGIRIVVQFHAKSPSEVEDKVDGAYMSALSTKLGLIEHGILVVYFADDPDWRIWFGNQVAPLFAGKPGKTAKELTADHSIHNAKEAFLDACSKQADEEVTKWEPSVNPRIAINGHAIVEGRILADGLMKRLGPKP